MVMDPKALQDRLDGPPTTHARNINIDTHIGQAPQRPYALLEDHMAAIVDGYRDLGALERALAGQDRPDSLPDGAPHPNEVKEEGGDLVRYVVGPGFRDQLVRDGRVVERVTFEKRYVSLTMAGARAADSPERPTDYWNGFTWLRGGFKPERDFPVMAHQANQPGAQDLVFEIEADPSNAAVLRHQIAAMDRGTPPLPVAHTRPASRGKE
jgi:hypothetical protein